MALQARLNESQAQLERERAKAEAASQQRHFLGAQISRWNKFVTTLESADLEIKRDYARLKEHARDLAKNNPWMARYVSLKRAHVVGPKGIIFQSGITSANGTPRDAQNRMLEDAWRRWCKRGVCTLDGRLSFLDVQHLFIGTAPVDGEVLIRKIKGAPNPFGFAIEFIDSDRLDHTYNIAPGPGRNAVVMGVEQDQWGRPVAYWIWSAHPSDVMPMRRRIRIPAEEIVHAFKPRRPWQSRGCTWAHPVLLHLNMLGRLWESELVASNAEADRLGFLTSKLLPLDPDDPGAVKAARATQPDPRKFRVESDYGSWVGLPAGIEPSMPAPNHPNTAFAEFSKHLLYGIASGLHVSYPALHSDLSQANYGSMRGGSIEERNEYRLDQQWMIDTFLNAIFPDWLECAILSGQVNLRLSDWDKICKPLWFPRGWEWIDPRVDVLASKEAISGGLSTLQAECAAQGLDWRENIDRMAEAQEYAKKKGVVLDFSTKGSGLPAAMAAQEKEDPGEELSTGGKTKNGGADAEA
jgi:lambda family phage portal protein